MENIRTPSTPTSTSSNSAETTIPSSPKKIFHSIPRSPYTQISNSALNQMQKKRTFNLEFQDFEAAPSKALKPSETKRILQRNVFKAGSNSQNLLSKIELQKCISEAISTAVQPLISEIQALKSEVLSLKKVKKASIPQQSPISESEKPTESTQNSQSTQSAENSQKTAQKTFAEIAKLNSLVTEQSIKLDKWTIIKRKNSLKNELAPKKDLDPVDSRILFRREISESSINIPDLLLAINLAIKRCGLPEHIRLLRLWESPSGAISGQLKRGANAEMLNSAKEEILKAVKKLDPSISSLQAAEQWYSLRIHKVCLQRYLTLSGMELLKEEIESTNGLNLPQTPRWINQERTEERYQNEEIFYSTVIIKVRSKSIANSLITKGIEFGGRNHPVEPFLETKADTLCSKCSKFGHNGYKYCQNQAKCVFCGENHETKDHKCQLTGCTAQSGTLCIHTPVKCINCNGPHLASSHFCSKKREILANMRKIRKEDFLKLQESRKKLAVIIPPSSTQNSPNFTNMEVEMETENSEY